MSAAVAVFGIALLAALLYAVLEKQAPAYALLLSLGAALVLLVRAGDKHPDSTFRHSTPGWTS